MQLSSGEVSALGARGFFVVDAFLRLEEVRALRQAAVAQVEQGTFKEAGVRRGGDHHLDARVRSDRIQWVDPTGPFELIHQRLEALRLQLNEAAWLGLRTLEVQLAWYPPNGAHYDRHLDSFPGSDNRRLSVVVYLNEGWQPAHGGQLRLHVDPPLDVEPLAGRAVVFLSEKIEHEVLASHADRFAFAAWFSR